MLALSFQDVSMDHHGAAVFDGASFELNEGDRVALVGENGSGKSTLFALISGVHSPSAGVITRKRNLTVGHLRQQADDLPLDKTVLEATMALTADHQRVISRMRELETALADPSSAAEPARLDHLLEEFGSVQERFESIGGYDLEHRAKEVLTGLRFRQRDFDVPVGSLSGGQKKFVQLACLLLQQPDLLLLDEPDNHLDFEAKTWLEHFLAEYPGTVLLISHDRYVLDRVASRILELEDGAVSVFDGNYTYYVTERQRRLERRQQMYAIEQEEIKRLEATLRDLKQWARMNPKFAPRAENMEKRVARARRDAAIKPTLTRKVLDVRFDAERSGQLVIECKKVSKSFGDRVVLRPFDFFVRYGDRVGVVGPNGSGKTTFVKVITGVEPADSGVARIGASVVVGYYAQEQETLPLDAAIVDYIRSLKRLSDQQAIGVLNRLLFTRDEGFTKIGKLSGGEKSRLQIARLMLTDANLLVLDEPTNNLDIASIGVLEQALEEFKGSILTVSHDRYFLDRTVTRIAEIPGGGQVAEYHGNYSDYLHKKAP